MQPDFILLNRQIRKNKFWQMKPFSPGQAWIDLIMEAHFSFEPKQVIVDGKTVYVKRGELFITLQMLAERWGWSKSKVCRFLSETQSETQIATQKFHRTTLISIVNYAKWQFPATQTKRNVQRTYIKGTNNVLKNVYSDPKPKNENLSCPACGKPYLSHVLGGLQADCKCFPAVKKGK